MQYQKQSQLIIILLCLTTTMLCAPSPRSSILKTQANTLLTQQRITPVDVILFWNGVTLQAGANDYDTSIASSPDQAGPTTTSRAFAIIHGAMYEAMKAFDRVYQPIFSPNEMPRKKGAKVNIVVQVAVTEAAYQTLSNLYPKQQELFDAVHDGFMEKIDDDSSEKTVTSRGVLVGQIVAARILTHRQFDNSRNNVTYTPTMQIGYHQVDPTHPNQGFLSPQWGTVKPFVIQSGSQFRASNIIGETVYGRNQYLCSSRYISDYNEVVSLGSRNSQTRTANQTEIGIFWGYDGAPKIGVPPRLYNQIVRVIAIQKRNTPEQNARLFALVNYAMADAGIVAWETKYYYGFWRPVVGIRQRTPYTTPIPNWTPLGAPSDGNGDNFTPSFPSYVSGHSTFGSATFETLRLFYGTDVFRFQFQSDEYNGVTIDSITSLPRPIRIRQYQTFSQAEDENYLSRIYLGVHWRIDQEEGRRMGRQVAAYVFTNLV